MCSTYRRLHVPLRLTRLPLRLGYGRGITHYRIVRPVSGRFIDARSTTEFLTAAQAAGGGLV
jgi:hypothetical protein